MAGIVVRDTARTLELVRPDDTIRGAPPRAARTRGRGWIAYARTLEVCVCVWLFTRARATPVVLKACAHFEFSIGAVTMVVDGSSIC